MTVDGLERLNSVGDITEAFNAKNNDMKIHTVVGNWGGRKFYLGNDEAHLFTLSEFVQKIEEITEAAEKTGTISSADLAIILKRVKQLDTRAHEKVSKRNIGIRIATSVRRALSHHTAQGNIKRFEANIEKQRKKELKLIESNRQEYYFVLNGTKTVERSDLDEDLKKPLRNAQLPAKLFVSVTDTQKMHDIHCRLLAGKPINFDEMIGKIEIKLNNLDFSGVPFKFEKLSLLKDVKNKLKSFTNSELERIDEGLQLAISNKMTMNKYDPNELIPFINFLKEPHYEEEILAWISKPGNMLSKPNG